MSTDDATPKAPDLTPRFYIISIAHTKSRDGIITFWGPAGCDYYFRLNLCGKYTAEELTKCNIRSDTDRDKVVPVEVVEALAINVEEAIFRGCRSLDERGLDDLVVEHQHLRALKALKPEATPR